MQPTAELTLPLPANDTWIRRFLTYGWGTILVGALAMAATYPGRTHGLGMVTEPLLKDLHMADDDGRVFFSSLNLCGTLIGALFCLPVGWLFDRYDRRWILAGNLVLFGAAIFWMSRVQSWVPLFVCLILTRGLGQSALSVVSITIVAKSFQPRQLGVAMAWYAVFAAPCYAILTRSVGWMLPQLGWRAVWGGIGLALVALAAIAFFVRRDPLRSRRGGTPIAPAVDHGGTTFRQALATPAFWVFSLTISIWGMISSGIALFYVDIFRWRGFDQQLYFNVAALMPLVALAANLVFGWLSKYVRLTYLLAVCLLATSAALGGLPLASEEWHAYLYGVVLGIASGAVSLLFFAAWGTMFGPRDLGRIQGAAQMLTVFASALGPLAVSASKRAAGSYTLYFLTLAVILLIMALAAWFTPMPRFSKETST